MPRSAIKRKNVVVTKKVRSVVTNVNANHSDVVTVSRREQNSREDVKNTKRAKPRKRAHSQFEDENKNSD